MASRDRYEKRNRKRKYKKSNQDTDDGDLEISQSGKQKTVDRTDSKSQKDEQDLNEKDEMGIRKVDKKRVRDDLNTRKGEYKQEYDGEQNLSKKRKKSKSVGKDRDRKEIKKSRQRGEKEDCSNRETQHEEGNMWGEESHNKDRHTTLHDNRPLFHKADEDVLMILTGPSEVCLKGKCHVTSLCGKVSILGYHVTPSSGSCDFYSPECNSLLTIKPIEFETNSKQISTVFDRYLDKKDKKRFPKQNSIILLLTKFNNVACDYLTKFPPFQQLFTVSDYGSKGDKCDELESIDVALIKEDSNLTPIRVTEDYHFVADKWISSFHTASDSDSASILVVCGGKNSGKSTLNRFLLNSALNKLERVCYLECDVGQTEFTPPGCIALHIVDLPLLGPPFCHQRHSNHVCYFGRNSPADDPDHYMKCLKQCFSYYRQMDNNIPLLVNTMGWNKGLGLDLMVDTLRLIKPDMVIQLDCFNQSLNFPALTPEFIDRQQGWIAKSQLSMEDELKENDKHKDHKLFIIESVVDQQQQQQMYVKFKALDHRNLAIMGYLSQSLEPGMTLTSVPPYIIDWRNIGIHVVQEAVPVPQIMYALNATVVALCNADLSQACRDNEDNPLVFKEVPDSRCIGFGIIRGIDPEKKQIYIITPLSPVQLKQVNTLIRGTTNIPDQLLLKQKHPGDVPYIDISTTSTGASALRQRKHMPRKYNT